MRDVEAKLEARDSLRVLKETLEHGEWLTLLRVAECGGIAKAHSPQTDGGYECFKKAVQRLRAQARRILDETLSPN